MFARPTATAILTSALPHHQAPRALTPGRHASRQARVSSATDAARHSLAGTCWPAMHAHNPMDASRPSRQAVHASVEGRDILPGDHRFHDITLAMTVRENLNRRGRDGREARHQRVHILTGGSPPCNESTYSYGPWVSWEFAGLLPWPSRAPPTRKACMSPWGSDCQSPWSSLRSRWWSPRSRQSSTPCHPSMSNPQPVVVEPSPVMVQPPVMHGQPSYRGYASYGGYGRPWRHRHHDDGDHDEHGHYWRSNGWHG